MSIKKNLITYSNASDEVGEGKTKTKNERINE